MPSVSNAYGRIEEAFGVFSDGRPTRVVSSTSSVGTASGATVRADSPKGTNF
jgi:hypothetical protein